MSGDVEVDVAGVRYCTPMWGSCALLSGHVGPHHGYPENIEAVVAARVEEAKAEAWDEGVAAPRMVDGSEEPAVENPYRAAALDPEEER